MPQIPEVLVRDAANMNKNKTLRDVMIDGLNDVFALAKEVEDAGHAITVMNGRMPCTSWIDGKMERNLVPLYSFAIDGVPA